MYLFVCVGPRMCTTHLLATGCADLGMHDCLFINFGLSGQGCTRTAHLLAWMNWPRDAHSICTSTSAIACLDVPVRDAHSIYITSMHGI